MDELGAYKPKDLIERAAELWSMYSRDAVRTKCFNEGISEYEMERGLELYLKRQERLTKRLGR